MSAHQKGHFSPNAFHFEKDPDTGALVMKPGLGADEPDEKAAAIAEEAAEQYRLREEALARATSDVRQEAVALERRATEMERREAELAARERAFEEKRAKDQDGAIEKAFVEGTLPEADRRKPETGSAEE